MYNRFVIYDFETNGLWSQLNQPIQVALNIIEKDGKAIGYDNFISCPTPLSITIEKKTGITDEMLHKHGKPMQKVFKDLNKIIHKPNTLLIGHNIIRFDNLFLNYYNQIFGFPTIEIDNCFDTMAQVKADLMGLTKSENQSYGEFHATMLSRKTLGRYLSLKSTCKYYKIPVIEELHQAPVDVDYTHKVFKVQANKLGIIK